MHFAAALPVLLVLDVMVRLFGVRRTRELLQHLIPLRSTPWGHETTTLSDAGAVALALDRAGARVCRWRGHCLRRSLALWAWLRLHGVDAEVQLGVRRDGHALLGHAWVSCGGHVIAEPAATSADHVAFGGLHGQ